jgi:hypothetical protein
MGSFSVFYLMAAVVLLLIAVCVIAARTKKRKALVICPPANLPAEVVVDPSLRIFSCSRLPDGHQCDRHCLPQLGFASGDLGAFLASHGGKSCTSCGTVISADDWYKSRLRHQDTPATEVREEKGQHSPVCWECFSGMNQQPS